MDSIKLCRLNGFYPLENGCWERKERKKDAFSELLQWCLTGSAAGLLHSCQLVFELHLLLKLTTQQNRIQTTSLDSHMQSRETQKVTDLFKWGNAAYFSIDILSKYTGEFFTKPYKIILMLCVITAVTKKKKQVIKNINPKSKNWGLRVPEHLGHIWQHFLLHWL